MKKRLHTILFLALCFVFIKPEYSLRANEIGNDTSYVKLRILETTDTHSYLLDYDYKEKKRTVEFGYNRVASLIQQARKESPNNLLFDVGDILKGSAIADYVAESKLLFFSDIHPAYKAMNLMEYDGATVGNHEFNFGLDYMWTSTAGATFPYTNANIYLDDQNHLESDDMYLFPPYLLLNKEVVDEMGEKVELKIGVLGLITPITQEWDKEYFEDNLIIKNMQESAERIVPQMKKEGADIIIALVHAGLQSDEGNQEKQGNNVLAVSKVKDIDVILFGHSHLLFPMKGEKGSELIDHERGLINGKPAVQAGFWGNHLGIIDLLIERKNNRWKIVDSKSQAKPIIRILKEKKVPIVSPYLPIDDILVNYHQGTLNYLEEQK